MSWEASAREVREALDTSIPTKWKLDQTLKSGMQDVTSIPETCGILSTEHRRITELDASNLVKLLAQGELSAVQVTEAFCARAAIAHQLVNCLTVFFPEQALATAKELDEQFAKTRKPTGPLHGLPIALKDTFDVPGYATTWGYAANANHRAERESATVRTLRQAGAVFFAKTTMPQAGMLLETVSNLYGRTLNPRNLRFGSGGSSGGDGALVALRGSPVTPSTDIGGSIRAPAAFNGLYGIRPSADRVPKQGMKSVEISQLNIRVSVGPVSHSMADLKLLTKVLTAWPQARYDSTCMPFPWREVDKNREKLAFGLWDFDGVVMPHPPILRALQQTRQKLEAAGHEVIKFKMPFDCWEASQTYASVTYPFTAVELEANFVSSKMSIYYQCGNADSNGLLEMAGEEVMPAYKKMTDIYGVTQQALDAKQLLKLIQRQSKYREALSAAWDATATQTSSGKVIDGIICPVSPLAGYPHDFLPWWGYTTLFNLVDYPSTVIPVKHVKISSTEDPKDTSYQPMNNVFDSACQDIYDPQLWENMPVALQIVARPFDDEELLAATEVVDSVINHT